MHDLFLRDKKSSISSLSCICHVMRSCIQRGQEKFKEGEEKRNWNKIHLCFMWHVKMIFLCIFFHHLGKCMVWNTSQNSWDFLSYRCLYILHIFYQMLICHILLQLNSFQGALDSPILRFVSLLTHTEEVCAKEGRKSCWSCCLNWVWYYYEEKKLLQSA